MYIILIFNTDTMTFSTTPCPLATVPRPILARTVSVLVVTSTQPMVHTLLVLSDIAAMVAPTTKFVVMHPLDKLHGYRHHCTICCLQVVNYELFKDFTVVATSGPTHQELPPFKWSDTEWARPKGHPDEFKFQPVYINFN